MRVAQRIRVALLALAAPVLATGCAGGIALVGLGVALSGGGGGGGGGVPAVVPPIQVSIVSATSESGTDTYVEGAVTIVYRLSHPDGTQVRVHVEYATGDTYAACFRGGGDPVDVPIDIGPTPIDRTFVWSTRDQGLPLRIDGVRLRVLAEAEGDDTSGSVEYPPAGQNGLSLDNAEPPTIAIVGDEIASAWTGAAGGGAPIVSGTVTVPFVIADAEGDPASWRAEVRIGADGSWAEIGSDSIQPTPQGMRGETSWDSGAVLSEDVTIRITAEDTYAGHVKAARIPAAVSLRAENRAPVIASIEPQRIPAYGEHEVRIRATDFYDDAALQVLAGGDPAAIDRIEVIDDESAIVARVARTVHGPVPIVVVNPNGRESPAVEIAAERVVAATSGQAEFETIQDAIANAAAGGESDATIHVLPGTHGGSVAIDGMQILLRALAASGDPDEPAAREEYVIQGDGGSPVIAIDGGGPHVRGFTITGGAGGIRAAASDGLIIEDCDIRENTGPGVEVRDGPSTHIAGAWIRHNEAVAGGGILFVESWGRIEDTRIEENGASTSGGGISVERPDVPSTLFPVTLLRTTVAANRAANTGGGLFVRTTPNAPVVLACSLVEGNRAGAPLDTGLGGGVYLGSGPLAVISTTVSGNRAWQADGGGGIYAIHGADLHLTNAILAWNFPDDVGGGELGHVTVAASIVLISPLSGVLIQAPLFVKPGSWSADDDPVWSRGDFHLREGSPGIGIADPVDATAWGLSADDLAADIEGTSRDAEPDLGAYEWTEE
ncbi:MAG: right-handed parallel beta-helix repeat-containing protein [Planctomycetes bacterium]|nr:right-handed parallel beta-helix repeat-containing protein [Planctomycetota bacterium]